MTDGLENMHNNEKKKKNEINPVSLSFRPQGRVSVTCHKNLKEKQNFDNRQPFSLEDKHIKKIT